MSRVKKSEIEMSDTPSLLTLLARPFHSVLNAAWGGGSKAPIISPAPNIPMSDDAVRAPYYGYDGSILLLCYGVETGVVLHSEALQTLYSRDRSIIEYMINFTMLQRYGTRKLNLVNAQTRHIPSIVEGWVAELDSILDIDATQGIVRRRNAVQPVLYNLYKYIIALTTDMSQHHRQVIVETRLYRQPPPPARQVDEAADLAEYFRVFGAKFKLEIVSRTMRSLHFTGDFASDHHLEVPFGLVFHVNDGHGIKQTQEKFACLIMLGWLSELDYTIDSDMHNSNFSRMRNLRSLYDVEKEYIRLYEFAHPQREPPTMGGGKLPYSRPMDSGGGGQGGHRQSSRSTRNAGVGSRSGASSRSFRGLLRGRLGRM
jgi:hypothetical protein